MKPELYTEMVRKHSRNVPRFLEIKQVCKKKKNMKVVKCPKCVANSCLKKSSIFTLPFLNKTCFEKNRMKVVKCLKCLANSLP